MIESGFFFVIRYQRFYDDLSRLIEADYDSGTTIYSYGYDLAGNLVDFDGVTRTFNSANQMTNDGTNTLTYDNNGNLTSDGTNTHTWDRANRLLSVGNHSYAYDGNGARIQKTVSSIVIDYLLDVQPGLTQVLRESDETNTNHYIHAPRGIHAMNDGTNWSYMLQDGLGSVRAEIAQNVAVNGSQSYAPYGEVFSASGLFASPYGYTGEQTDGNGQVYLRARYYNPGISVFNALDPFEGTAGRPMSLNGYSWVEGNPVMNVDPSGMVCDGLTGLDHLRCLNSGCCSSIQLQSPPCAGEQFDECDLRYLAHAASAEATNAPDVAIAAIILAQINYSKRPGSVKFYGFRTVEQYLEKRYDDVNITDQVAQTYSAFRSKCLSVGATAIAPTAIGTYSKALSMARKMNCSSNPLGSFPFFEFNISGTNRQKLEHIANTPTLSQERSFGGGVVEKLNELRQSGSSLFNALRQGGNNDWIDFTRDDPMFTKDYVIFGGTNRSVVIYSYEVNLGINPHLQCAQSIGSALRYALKKTASTDAEDICATCDSGTSVLHTNSSFFKRCEVQGVCRGWYCKNGVITNIEKDTDRTVSSNSGCAAIATKESGKCWS